MCGQLEHFEVATMIGANAERVNSAQAQLKRRRDHNIHEAETEIDSAPLAEIRDELGAEFLVYLLKQCAYDAQTQFEGLSAAIAASDLAAVRVRGHSLKGLFAQFGARGTARSAALFESAATLPEPELVDKLRISIERTLLRFASIAASL